MFQIFVKNREIIVPGTVVAEGKVNVTGPHIKEGNRIIATTICLVETNNKSIKLVPLSSKYIPKKEDLIIGKIIEVLPNGWQVDINSPYIAFMPIREAVTEFIDVLRTDLSQYYDIGEYVILKVVNVTKRGIVHVSTKGPTLKKIKDGLIISITPSKVPRVIGKKGSMVQMIKQITGCNIIVGQNGRVWIKGKSSEIETIVASAIRMIERESHKTGLTDRIREFLEKEMEKLNKKGN